MSEKVTRYKEIMDILQICAHDYHMNLHKLSRLIQSFSTRQRSLSTAQKIPQGIQIPRTLDLYAFGDASFIEPNQEIDISDFFARVEKIFGDSNNNIRKGFLEISSKIEKMALEEEQETRLRQQHPDLQKMYDEYQVALKLYKDH